MSNDDLHRGSDDEARTRPSDTPNADIHAPNFPEFSEFGELPGFTPLPDLAPLPELAPLPDLDDLLAETPSPLTDEADAALPVDALTPDGLSSEETAPTSTDTASPTVATASSQEQPEGDATPTTELHTPRPESSGTRVDTAAVKRKPSVVMIVLACVATLNFGIVLFVPGLFESSSTPSSKPSADSTAATNADAREHAANLPARAPGYRGSATNTHSISPQWASGVATAWTLPIPEQYSALPPQVYVDGSTVYLVGPGSPEGDASQAVTVTAYDVSGEQPALLWSSTGPSASDVSSPYTPAFVSSDDSVFWLFIIGGVVGV